MAKSPSSQIAEWPLPSAVTLGSAVRAKGIERELRRRLSWSLRRHLTVEAGRVVLSIPSEKADDFPGAAERIAAVITGLAELPLLPSEVEDILAISSRERHKWLEDGRLRSAGTRTVKLRGRARAVTFHVFDPSHIEAVLDGDLPAIWREDDARTRTDNRRRAAAKTAMARAAKAKPSDQSATEGVAESSGLDGWDEFDAEGFLR